MPETDTLLKLLVQTFVVGLVGLAARSRDDEDGGTIAGKHRE